MKEFKATQRFAMSMTIVAVLVVTALCFSDMTPRVSEFLSLRRQAPSSQKVESAEIGSIVMQPIAWVYAAYIAAILVAAVVIIAYLGRATS